MSEFKAKLNPFTGTLQLIPTNVVLAFKAGVASQANLPLTSNAKGDARIANDTGHLYVWSIESSSGLLTDWADAGDIVDLTWAAISGKPTSSVSDIDDAVTKRHSQNTDTELGAMASDIDANSHKVKNLSVPTTNGDSIRATSKITEALLESATDLKHTHSNKTELDKVSDGDHDVRTDNPHSVTKDQVGLGNCDNTSDANKPVSTAQDTAIKEIKHIEFLIDGNGFVITDGVKTPYKFVPFNCTITGWDILASNSDTFSIDILYNETFSSVPASITGTGTKPNLSASASGSGTTLTGWTATSLAKGGVLAVQVSGTPAAATWAILRIRVQ